MTASTTERPMTTENSASEPSGLIPKLSIMMFLQYAIWGAWLPLFFAFLTKHRGLSPEEAGTLFAIAAVGALIAPFIAGQIADRWFSTEKFLGISHLIGAVLVWQLATVESYDGLIVYGLLYSLIYAPTLPLTNSLAFHHLADRDRDFGRVRVWGTIGWIAVGIGMGQWLLRGYAETNRIAGYGDSFRLSAIIGVVLGVFCFFLPHTPPQKGKEKFAVAEAFNEIVRSRLLVLFLIAFPISVVHQFYFVRTVDFLGSLKMQTPWIDQIFGVGGGPMTIGQIAEIAVLAFIPFIAKKWSKKLMLGIGLTAYVLRFAVFAYLQDPVFVFPALALHGLCFGFFFFLCFMIIDEVTSPDVRASAQSLFNLVIVGIGVIVGNYAAGKIGEIAKSTEGTDYKTLFAIPMWITVACLVALIAFYPSKQETPRPA